MEPEYYKNEIQKSIDDIDRELEIMQDRFIQGATLVGYTRSAIKAFGSSWLNRIESSQSTDFSIVVQSTSSFLSAFKNEIKDTNEYAEFMVSKVVDIASSSASVCSATSAFDPDLANYSAKLKTPLTSFKQNQHYAERFSVFNPALGKTYKEIEEVLFGTKSDPERAAMFLTRQAFDQFFSILAPDQEVRSSNFWREKNKEEGDDPNAIWREERLKYAAAKHVKDPSRSATLSEQTAQILETYKLLNKAHKRGELNKDQAFGIVDAIKTTLEEWADAIDI